jgi:kumamolisin
MLIAGTSCATAGTSAVVPLWAALVARLNQSLGGRIGHLNPLLYHLAETHQTSAPRRRKQTIDLAASAQTHTFRPVTRGNNGHYKARHGWNPCAGHGTLHGETLLAHLRTHLSRSSPATRK